MEEEEKERYEFYFRNPWCPLTGDIPGLLHNFFPSSPVYQCKTVILEARMLLQEWCDYVSVEAGIYSDLLKAAYKSIYEDNKRLFPHPCDDCDKSIKTDSRFYIPCKSLNCLKYDEWIDSQNEIHRKSLCQDTQFFPDPANRQKLMIARAIYDYFSAIWDHTLYWGYAPYSLIELHKVAGRYTFSSLWEKAIDETKEWARYQDRDNNQMGYIDDETPDYVILSVLAISQAWITLRDILTGWPDINKSKDDPDILKKTAEAKDFLAKAKELLRDEERDSLYEMIDKLETEKKNQECLLQIGEQVIKGAAKGGIARAEQIHELNKQISQKLVKYYALKDETVTIPGIATLLKIDIKGMQEMCRINGSVPGINFTAEEIKIFQNRSPREILKKIKKFNSENA